MFGVIGAVFDARDVRMTRTRGKRTEYANRLHEIPIGIEHATTYVARERGTCSHAIVARFWHGPWLPNLANQGARGKVGTVPVDFGPVRYMSIRLSPPPRRREGLDPLSSLMPCGNSPAPVPRGPRLAL